jgi:hypothetical protein
MNEQRKKAMKRQWRARSSPCRVALPFDDLKAMFDMLDAELSRQGCDRTGRLTQRWLGSRGHDAQSVLSWLDKHGGFCNFSAVSRMDLEYRIVSRSPHLPSGHALPPHCSAGSGEGPEPLRPPCGKRGLIDAVEPRGSKGTRRSLR